MWATEPLGTAWKVTGPEIVAPSEGEAIETERLWAALPAVVPTSVPTAASANRNHRSVVMREA
jgi:hypothetical protein